MKLKLVVVILLLLTTLTAHGQPSPSSPDCNEGRIPLPRTDPRHPFMHCFEPWGVMTGIFSPSDCPRNGEGFGSAVVPLADVDHDGLADIAVQRTRCDTLSNGVSPIEWYVYHGVRGGVPDSRGGMRIGPTEVGSETRILSSGDWDADGNIDIVATLHPFGDTSEQWGHGYPTVRVCVFWGTGDGQYSIDDTTRLVLHSDLWTVVGRAASADCDGDGVADLVMYGRGSLERGHPIETARLEIFRGTRNSRWGAGPIPRTPTLAWWGPPPFNDLRIADQDCDGNPDIVLTNQVQSTAFGNITVLYGRRGELPDTTTAESISLAGAGGHYSLFADMTGDHIPELLANCGDQEVIKLFAGRPGQRLLQMYGSGNDSLGRRPWGVIRLPMAVDPDDWFSSGYEPLFDLGDVNLDDVGDIWIPHLGFFFCYTGGRYLDSYIDAGMRWGYETSVTRLGDIDGSGIATFAVGYGGTPGGLALFHATDSIPPTGYPFDLPHPPGFQCEHTLDVREDPGSTDHGHGRPELSVVEP